MDIFCKKTNVSFIIMKPKQQHFTQIILQNSGLVDYLLPVFYLKRSRSKTNAELGKKCKDHKCDNKYFNFGFTSTFAERKKIRHLQSVAKFWLQNACSLADQNAP